MRTLGLQMIHEGMMLVRAGYRVLLDAGAGVNEIYLRPGGVDEYRRPGGTDSYLRP